MLSLFSISCARYIRPSLHPFELGYDPVDLANFPPTHLEPRHRYKVTLTGICRVTSNPSHISVVAVIPIPPNCPEQIIEGYKLTPAPSRIVTSFHGYRYAIIDFGPLSDNMTAEFELVVILTPYRAQIPMLDPKVILLGPPIPEFIQDVYLKNGNYYQLKDPFIKQTAQIASGNAKEPLEIVKNITRYVHSHLYYKMSGPKQSAPVVLKRGWGSCTEYSFVTIALLRYLGIPARYVAGSSNNTSKNRPIAADRVYHKWVEVWLSGYGWVHLDPTGDKSPNVDSLGRWPGKYLVMIHETEPGLVPWNPSTDNVTITAIPDNPQLKIATEKMEFIWEQLP